MSQDLDNDVRLIRRNLAKGFVSQATIDKQLAALPDVENLGEWTDPTAEPEPEAAAPADE